MTDKKYTSLVPDHVIIEHRNPSSLEGTCTHCGTTEGPLPGHDGVREFGAEHRDCQAPEEVIIAADIPGLGAGVEVGRRAVNAARNNALIALGRDKTEPEDQPMPVQNDQPYIHDLVARDIQARKELGTRRYGTALQPFNGRDVLKDTYEELLDAACYIRQKIFERDAEAEKFVGELDAEDFAMRYHNCIKDAFGGSAEDFNVWAWQGMRPDYRAMHVAAAKAFLETLQRGMGKAAENA